MNIQATLNHLQEIFSQLALFGGDRTINVYVDGRSYHSINLTTNEVGFSYHVPLDERLTFDTCSFDDLCLSTQIELLLAAHESIGS